MFEDTEVGDLPDCNTSQMLEALDGHLSLVHSNYAPEADDEKSSTEDNDGGSQDQVLMRLALMRGSRSRSRSKSRSQE